MNKVQTTITITIVGWWWYKHWVRLQVAAMRLGLVSVWRFRPMMKGIKARMVVGSPKRSQPRPLGGYQPSSDAGLGHKPPPGRP